jgi:hypothetical protein
VSGFVYKNNGQSAYEDEEPGVSWLKVLEKNHKAVRPTKRAYREKLEKSGKDCPSGAAGAVGAAQSAPRAELMLLRRGNTPL